MKRIKTITSALLMIIIMTSFSKCSSTKTSSQNEDKQASIALSDNTPLELGQVSFQKWAAGIKEGGSGIHMYIPVISNKKQIVLDSIFFRGLKGKIIIGKMGYFSSLKTRESKSDINMSSDTEAEHGNELPRVKNFPFELEANECVISYLEGTTIKYFKESGLQEKPAQNYPSNAPKE